MQHWKTEYERAGINDLGRDLSHVDHPHTGCRLLGLGVEVKGPDGSLIEAQVQLAVWMAGLVSWGFANRTSHNNRECVLPPMMGCTVVGEDWKLYIVYGIAGPSSQLSEVRLWGPHSVLKGETTSEIDATILARRLRRVMQYISTSYAERLVSTITGT
ncbi:hypothetical protein AWENTII_001978 [Aspergillus wentii]